MRLFFAVGVFWAVAGLSLPAFAQSAHGVFKVVKGDVTVTLKDGKSNKAKIGMKVQPGEKIKAGKDSRAKIVMVDQNEINVSPDSEIVIQDYEYKPAEDKKNVLINVLYGKVRAKVNQKYDGDNKFQVKTKSAVAGVRGTDFFTSYNPANNATKVVTFEGKVQFGLPGPNGAILNPVMVGVGQTTTVVGNAPPPPPVEMPKNELASFDSASDAEKGGPEPREPAAQPNNEPTKKDEPKKTDDARTDAPKADAPKADAPKGDAPQADGASAPGVTAGASGASGGASGGGSNEPRAPASLPPAGGGVPVAGPGSMIRPEDIPSAGGVIAPIAPPPLPPAIMPPPPVLNPPVCDICNRIIEGQNKTLRITISGP